MVLFNNCGGRDFVQIYNRDDAFYDLDVNHRQCRLVENILPGTECVVASYDGLSENGERMVAFRHFSCSEAIEVRDDEDTLCKVFCGPLLRMERILRQEAPNVLLYAHFFNGVGHFKQRSVIIA
jgi:hypothetical protein